MHDVWNLPTVGMWEKTCGKHPTQKPLRLLYRILISSTKAGEIILDPFAGSCTTGIAANLIGRRYLGIEREQEFVEISRKRREEINNFKVYGNYRFKIKDIARSEIYEPNCFVCEEEAFVDLPF